MGFSRDQVDAATRELRSRRAKSSPDATGSDGPKSPPSKRATSPSSSAPPRAKGGQGKRKPFAPFFLQYLMFLIALFAVARVLHGPFPFEVRLKANLAAREARREAMLEAHEALRAELPLIFAAGDGDAAEVKRLLAAGADVMERSKVGETPLHVAAIKGDPETIRALLEAGADPDAITAGGQYLKMTPLHWLTYGKHHEGMRLLLQHGANPNPQNTKGETPWDIAAAMGGEANQLGSGMRGIPALKILAEHGGKSAKATGEAPPADDDKNDGEEEVDEGTPRRHPAKTPDEGEPFEEEESSSEEVSKEEKATTEESAEEKQKSESAESDAAAAETGGARRTEAATKAPPVGEAFIDHAAKAEVTMEGEEGVTEAQKAKRLKAQEAAASGAGGALHWQQGGAQMAQPLGQAVCCLGGCRMADVRPVMCGFSILFPVLLLLFP